MITTETETVTTGDIGIGLALALLADLGSFRSPDLARLPGIAEGTAYLQRNDFLFCGKCGKTGQLSPILGRGKSRCQSCLDVDDAMLKSLSSAVIRYLGAMADEFLSC